MIPRIAFFLPALYGGGVEKIVLDLTKSFYGRGTLVDLVLAKASGEYFNEIPYGIRVIDLNVKRVHLSVFPLVKYLKKEQPPYLLSALPHCDIAALIAKKLVNIETKIIVCQHVNLSKEYKNTNRLLLKILYPLLLRKIYPWSDLVIAVSQGMAHDASRWFGISEQDIHVIHNPIDILNIVWKSHEPINHKWFRPGQPPVILAMGRLTKQKNFSQLINAFNIVRKKSSCHLMILGEGECRHNLEKLVKNLGLSEDILLPGFVRNPYPYLTQASVFVLSSLWESFSVVLVEALALGVPVISTKCDYGPSEILEDGKYGTMVPVNNVTLMAQAILESLNKPRSSHGRVRARLFDLETIADQYQAILESGKYWRHHSSKSNLSSDYLKRK